jgi:glycosyltransferase involved in cell wall biosynthesis
MTLSHFMREEYLKHGFAAEDVVCVPYGPPAVLSPAARRAGVGGALLFVGRLDRLKGVHVLLDALPDAARRLGRGLTLTVVGDGPERQALEWQARSLAGSAVTVRFEGWLSPEARDARLLAADLLVVPSLWPEPFGLVGMEAARLGVPSVGFDVGGIRDWLAHGETGLLAPGDPPEASALAATIADALRDPGRLSEMGARAAAVASAGPTPGTHATALAGLLASLVAKPAAH